MNVKDPPSPEDLLNTDRCMKKWGAILGDCIVDCNAVPDCEAECIDDYKDNIEYCPCEVKLKSIPNSFLFEIKEPVSKGLSMSTYRYVRMHRTTRATNRNYY